MQTSPYVDEQREIVECGRLRAGRARRSMNGIGDTQVAAMMQQARGCRCDGGILGRAGQRQAD